MQENDKKYKILEIIAYSAWIYFSFLLRECTVYVGCNVPN